jgi:uncharacterized protein involved in exopolysaccharide biosynthesis
MIEGGLLLPSEKPSCGMFKRYWWMLLVMAPVGMVAGFMVAAVVTYVMPKMYESYAMIEIKPRMREGLGDAIPAPSGGTIFATEFEKIKSRNSLSKVVESLDLTTRWALDHESAIQVLKGIVQTQNIRETDLIQIRVRHTNKVDARDIAAEVARAYKDYRKELESKSVEAGIAELKKAVREQGDKVEESRKVGLSFGREPFLLDGSNLPKLEDSISQARDEAMQEFETELELLDRMKLQLVTEEINKGISGETMVIHDDPVIAHSPISPNVTLNLVAGAVGGLLISPFLALPLMWGMSRRKPIGLGE